MSDTQTRTKHEPLERIADDIARKSRSRDHGIAWAKGEPTDLRTALARPSDDPSDARPCPVEPDTTLISLLWDGLMYGYAWLRLFTVELPSGRQLLVADYDPGACSYVLGVIDGRDDRAHLRAFQAVIAGDNAVDPLLVGFPSELELAFGGVVLVDALAQALRRFGHVREYLDDDTAGSGADDDARVRTIAALEEELEEATGPEYADRLEQLLEQAESRPAWMWSFDEEVRAQLPALAGEQPPIALYAADGFPASLDPLDGDDDQLYAAAAMLAANDAL